MFCNACGTPLAAGQPACAKCGQAIVGVRPAAGRVARHGQLVGILWIVYSCLTLAAGFAIIFVFGHLLPAVMRYEPPQPQGPPPEVVIGMIRPFMHLIAILLLVKGAAGIVAGIGILQRAEWSRILTIVIACISLLSLPFGTAIGVYSLWVLLGPESEAEFHRLPVQRPA